MLSRDFRAPKMPCSAEFNNLKYIKVGSLLENPKTVIQFGNW
jgi:hypothetical protein